MRILHLADIRGIGGLQSWVRELAAAQARYSHEVNIMLPPWASDLKRDECFTELPIHTWEPDLVLEFDIVHTHATAGFGNARWKTLSDRPAIVQTYYGTIAGIQIAMRWYQNLVGWNGLAVPRGILMEAKSGWGADQVIVVSFKVKQEIMRFYRVSERKITIIPSGYTPCGNNAPKEELRRRLALPEKGFLFLFVGRPDPVKGFESVLSAFRVVSRESPSTWLVVAPRDSHLDDYGVVGLSLPPHQMGRLYQACDAFINASQYDAYSLAVHEALAYGLPAIVNKGAGNADYCKHGVNALIVYRKSFRPFEEVLAEAMRSLMNSPALCKHLAQNAKRDFAPRTWDWAAEKTERVYLEAMTARQTGA